MTLIADIVGGMPLTLAIKGGKAAVDKLLELDPPERMLWIIHEQFGEQAGLARKDVVGWLEVDDLGDAIAGVVHGNLTNDAKDVTYVRELIAPQLTSTAAADRDRLAGEIADGMFLLAPWLHKTVEDGTAHVSHKLDRQTEVLLEAIRSGAEKAEAGAPSAAEAFLRGPLIQIGKEDEAEHARQLAEQGRPEEAAAIFQDIATALEEAELGVVGETYLALAAELYDEAGDIGTASRMLGMVAEAQVQRGAGSATLMIRKLASVLPAARRWEAEALAARVDFASDVPSALEALRVAVEKAATEDTRYENLANYTDLLAFAGKYETVLDVTEAIETGAPADEAALRIQLNRLDGLVATASADADKKWGDLLRDLDMGGEPTWAGIAWQRRGMQLAHDGELEGSHDAYRRAMAAFAVAPGWQEQAADALYSLQAASLVNAAPVPEMELRALAYEQRGAADTPVARADALARLAMSHRIAERFPDALQEYSLALAMHRRAGSLQGHLEISEKLGELFLKVGRPTMAMLSYIAGGKAKEAVEAAKLAPSDEIAESMQTDVARWERAAALAVLAAVGDRLPADFLAKHAPWVMEEAKRGPDSWVAPQPGHQARLALAAISLALPAAQRQDAVPLLVSDLGSGQIDVQSAAERCLEQMTRLGLTESSVPLLQSFLADPFNSRVSLEFLAERAREDERAQELLVAAAAEQTPALAVLSIAELVAGSADLVAAADEAAKKLSEAVNVERTEQGEIRLGQGRDYPTEAVAARFASVENRSAAVRRLLEITADPADSELNRRSAAIALFNMAAAIPKEDAIRVVEQLAPLAAGSYPLSRWDENVDDPLSRIRISVHTQAALWSAALGTMGRVLAEHPEIAREKLIEAVATTFQRGPEIALAAAVEALGHVTDIEVPVPLDALLVHPAESVRFAALGCWAARRDDLPSATEITALRSDGSVAVRQRFALLVGEVGDSSLLEEIAANDEHALVRQTAGKQLAELTASVTS